MDIFLPSTGLSNHSQYGMQYEFELGRFGWLNSGPAPSRNIKVRCPLCNNKSSIMYCVDCINSGKFTYSAKYTYTKAMGCGDRYMDKRISEVRQRGKMNLKLQEVAKAVQTKRLVEQIKQLKEKNELKKRTVHSLKNDILLLNKKCDKAKATIENRTKVNKRWRSRMQPSQDNLKNTKRKAALYRKELLDYSSMLLERCRLYITDLLTYILPVEYLQKRLSRECGMLPMESDGSDARTLYTVAGLYLPGSGCLASFKRSEVDGPGQLIPYMCACKAPWGKEIINSRNCQSININIVLANTAMLVNILARLMDVMLPKFISHAELHELNLPENVLNNLIAKLNVNVVYFCLAAGVPPDILCPPQCTIRNIMLLLHHLPIVRECLNVVMPDFVYNSLCQSTLALSCAPHRPKIRAYVPYINRPMHDDYTDLLLCGYDFIHSEDIDL